MSRLAAGALLGLVFGAGIVLLLWFAVSRRAPRLVERVGPYVASLHGLATAGSNARAHLPVTTLRRRARVDPRLATRLMQAGSSLDGPAFRLEQVVWAVGGGLLTVIATLVLAGPTTPIAAVLVLAAVGAVAGALARDRALARQRSRRQQAVEAGLPALADLVALCVTGGIGPVAAIERSATAISGPLAAEIARAADEIRSGTPAAEALGALEPRTGVAALGRLVDALLVSAERGSPLADVARAQAADVRAAERRRLLQVAGRKEALMLVPIVFLVLPSVVLVAVFPGVLALRLVVP